MSRPSPSRLRGEPRGFIMFLMLVFIPLLGILSLLAIDRTVGELLSSAKQVRDKQAFFRADGSATFCRGELRNRVQAALPERLKSLPIGTVAAYVPNDPVGLMVDYAYLAGASVGGSFSRETSADGPAARLSMAYTASGPYNCDVTVTSRGTPVNLYAGLPMPPAYLFRYGYAIGGTAEAGGVERRVTLQGTFSVIVQQESFARYALFTNCQKQVDCSPTNSKLVWFTSRTSFSGPVHTNGQFNFEGNPSGKFSALVDSVSPTALYYNNNAPLALNADSNGTNDVPTFAEGFERGSGNIPMPAATDADAQRQKALGVTSKPSTTGVTLGSSADGSLAGIYVNGDATISLSAPSASTALYTIKQGSTTTTVEVKYGSNPKQTTIQKGGESIVFNGVPNGMVFVDGGVNGLGGKLQKDSQVTIAATGDIQITNNLVYDNCAACTAGSSPSAEGATNILGLISWNGDVRITTGAPNDIKIHATVMTPNGEFRVDDYDNKIVGPRGTATVLGGVIENTYGPFGTGTKSAPFLSGYDRNFVFDTRMGRGMAPPFFPFTGRVISSVAGVNVRPNWLQMN